MFNLKFICNDIANKDEKLCDNSEVFHTKVHSEVLSTKNG